jgi:putative ABC transport system permease protein
MLHNFWRIANRQWRKRKGYSLLNIFGLTAGITCCLLIFEYVAYERSYDSFQEKAARIFRVQDENYQSGRMTVACASAMPALAPTLKREFPEVENACRLVKTGFLLANDAREVKFMEGSAFYADAAILDMFHLPLVEGDAKTALSGPGKIILSATVARKYFGQEDPLGKVLAVHSRGKTRPLQVTGVFTDYPANSHLKFNLLVSYATYSQVAGGYGQANDPTETSWGWTDFYTYVLLRNASDTGRLSTGLQAVIDKHYNLLPKNLAARDSYTLSLMPMRNIHLYSHYTEEAEPNGDGQSVSFLFLIAFFIIGIAWINYINLATARSLERAREIGVRKVLGALRAELIRQFMLESLFLNLLALVLALGVTLLLNPFFAGLTGRPLPGFFSLPLAYWGYFSLLFIAGTFLSGLYPALVLSRYQPVAVLKGLFKNAAGAQWLRRALIVGQFAASIILISGTLIIYRQMHYMRNQPLGADIDQMLILKGASAGQADSAYKAAFFAFKNDVLQVKEVKGMTASSDVMGEEILWSTDWSRYTGSDHHAVNLFHLGVGDDYIRSYGLRLVAGRDFERGYGTDRRAIILNESAVRELGYSSAQEAIGQLLKGGQQDMDSLHVVGVIADYHNESLQKAVQPLVLLPYRDRRAYYSVKMGAANPAATIAAIKTVWNQYFPADPYDYFFLDEFFGRQYEENSRFGEVFALFAALAIVIACFGLLGLSAFTTLQRTKEIGIRKVLGASVNSLLVLLSRDFVFLVLIALLIAIPVSWWAMSGWLQGFAYRISIGWWIFALAGGSAVAAALLTVGGQALKAALNDPVDALRSE